METINQKLNRLIKKINWLCHEMQQGRVNNNKLMLQDNIDLAEKRVTTPLSIAFVKMAEKGDTKGVENFARNMLKEQGRDFDSEMNSFIKNFK